MDILGDLPTLVFIPIREVCHACNMYFFATREMRNSP